MGSPRSKLQLLAIVLALSSVAAQGERAWMESLAGPPEVVRSAAVFHHHPGVTNQQQRPHHAV